MKEEKRKARRKEIIKLLQALSTKLDRAPTRKEFLELENAPHWRTVNRFFGSWNNALEAAECRTWYAREYSRSELIGQLIWLEQELGHVPKACDLSSFKTVAPISSFHKEFGSWELALKEADLDPYSKSKLVSQIIVMAHVFGRTPTTVLCDQYSKSGQGVSSRKIEKVFGSWNKAIEAAGLDPNLQFQTFSSDSLIRCIQIMYQELGRVPAMSDCNDYYPSRSGFPHAGVYCRQFGSWSNAVKSAGFEPNKPLPWLAIVRNKQKV